MEAPESIGIYRIDGLLGVGGMATVYRGYHTGLQRAEAVKVLPPEMAHDRGFVDRFLNEARVAAGLSHPNIATVYTVGDAQAPPFYFAMELVEGMDLAALIRHRGVIAPHEAIQILEQVADALDYAHSRGVIHRDVKPGNILIQWSSSGACMVKVVDFGIARAQEGEHGARLTRTGMIIGTPEYMSPEQGGSGKPVDYRTDIYSLGIIAFEMLCGRPPFVAKADVSPMSVIIDHIQTQPQSPATILPALPPTICQAILWALKKSAADRPETAHEFVLALKGAIRAPVGDKKESKRGPELPSGLVTILVVLAILGIGLVAVGIAQSLRHLGGPEPPAHGEPGPVVRDTPAIPSAIDKPQVAPSQPPPIAQTIKPVSEWAAVPKPHFDAPDLPSAANVGEPFEFTVEAQNQGTMLKHGSITVSFTANPEIVISSTSGCIKPKESIWKPGDTIAQLNSETEAMGNMTAVYPGAELYIDNDNWGSGGKRSLTLRVVPTQTGTMQVWVRCTLNYGKNEFRPTGAPKFYSYPGPGDGAERDQQNFWARSYSVEVR